MTEGSMLGRLARFVTMGGLTVACGLVLPASGMALDCTTARKQPDTAICRHPDLRALDAQMEGLWFTYKRFPFLMGASGARSDEERAFQEKRAACGGDAACLRRVYRARIEELKVNIAAAMDNFRRDDTAGPASFLSVLPDPVEGIIDSYADQCGALGGTLTGATRPKMLASDVDGDGRADYVLNPENLKCSAAATAFCGNGGCQIAIASSSNDYKDPIMVLGGQPTITQTNDGTRVDVWVHRSNCNITNPEQACWATFSWKDGKLEKSYRVRPRVD